jgi:WD40 repeat protein
MKKLCSSFPLLFFLITLNITTVSAQDAYEPHEIMRLGRGTAKALAWHPDGEVLAVGSGTGIWFFDSNFELLGNLGADLGGIDTLLWSPNGERLLSAGRMAGYHVWEITIDNLAEAQIIYSQEAKYTGCDYWSPDSNILSHMSESGIYQLDFNQEPLEFESIIRQVEYVDYVALSPDSRFVLRNNQIIDIDTQDTIQRLDINQFELRDWQIQDSLRDWGWSPDSQFITAKEYGPDHVGATRLLYVWNTGTGELLHTLEVDATYWAYQSIWSNDGGRFITVTNDPLDADQSRPFNQLTIWDTGSWQPIVSITYRSDWTASSYTWHPNGEIITTIDGNGTIRNWNATTGELLASHDLFSPVYSSLAWSPDGAQLAAAGKGFDKPVHIWNIGDANTIPDFPALIIRPQVVDTVAWTPDGQFIVTSGTDVDHEQTIYHNVTMWDAETGEEVQTLYHMQFANRANVLPPIIAWNSDFTRSVYSNRGNTVQPPTDIWNGASDDTTITVSGDLVELVAWSPDDSMLATASRIRSDSPYVIDIWGLEHRTHSICISPYDPELLAWSPDGTKLAIGGELKYGSDLLYICDVKTGNNVIAYGTDGVTSQVTWHPSSNFVAFTSVGIPFMVTDIETGERSRIFRSVNVGALAWHPSGDWLASTAYMDGTIRIWDVSELVPGD